MANDRDELADKWKKDSVERLNTGKNMRTTHFTVRSEHLSDGQSHHVEAIGKEFCNSLADKYIKGQREHGGNLYDKSIDYLLTEAINECIDQFTYLTTLRERIRNEQSAKSNVDLRGDVQSRP